ncbi:MAG: filamentous hemagglutinin N-terminal domain-containing protein, partial [Alphaproteobacteria bacterium]|nr:filamentous hemagglutinin N-terminal domain-containing protein [Alphaproteobacteria bacterium]
MKILSSSVAIVALLSLMPGHGQAAPLGGQVASGAAAISANGAITTIHQSSDRAVIDWQSFNLSQNETARFVVPSDSSATLNRISGGGASTISGAVESNGVVYFSNPNGLVFDATSRVSANGFWATTGTISNFDFMSSREVSNRGTGSVSLNGAITAPAITAAAGTVTVGGKLSAGSGKILLSSTNLTTIGSGATISAEGGLNNNGGNIKIWSDSRTEFLGKITAQGGTNSGDGGFVEVSGKNTLNFLGTVSTFAPHGKTGTLLLDPATIEIVAAAGSTVGVSYILVDELVNALSTNNVTIDANSSTTSGFALSPSLGTTGNGTIKLLAAFTQLNGTTGLTLIGSQIILKANISLLGSLTLTSTRASVWQEPNTVITATTLSGSSVDGFVLGGLNRFSHIGAITNSGGGGIWVKNSQAVTLDAGTLDGGSGGVAILAPGFDVTLGGAVTVKGSFLRLDSGSGRLLGGQTLTATGLDVFYTSAKLGNDATIAVGSGSFTLVHDERAVTAEKTLNNGSTAADWDSGFGAFVSGTATGGLTVTTSGLVGTINHQGVVYGGTVIIDGVASGAARSLRYVEGTGVATQNQGSSFDGSLVLVASGSGISVSPGGTVVLGGVVIGANLTTVATSGSAGDLTMLQTGTLKDQTGDIEGRGVVIWGVTVAAGRNLTVVQSGKVLREGILFNSAVVKSVGAMTVTQAGVSTGQSGIGIQFSTIQTVGAVSIVQSGQTGFEGIVFSQDTIAAGWFNLKQSGIAVRNGVFVVATTITSSRILSLVQSGVIGSGYDGIILSALGPEANKEIKLVSGGGYWLEFKTDNRSLQLANSDSFALGQGRVRIDLGTGAIKSLGGQSLKALGLSVYYTGAFSGNSAGIDVGSGSFTTVFDQRSQTSALSIDDTTSLSGWGTGLGTLASGVASGGLTVTTTGAAATINLRGISYGGAVTIDGVASGEAKNIGFIEAPTIQITKDSSFVSALTLVATGAGGATIADNLSTKGPLTVLATAGTITAGKVGGLVLTAERNLYLTALNFTMTSHIRSAGAPVKVNLGSTGVFGTYGNGASGSAGFTWTTENNGVVALLAAGISNTTATNPLWRLGTAGNFAISAQLSLAKTQAGFSSTKYNGDYIKSDADAARLNDPNSVYYITSDMDAALDNDKIAESNPKALWLNSSVLSLTGNLLGTKTRNSSTRILNTGFFISAGEVYWGNAGVDFSISEEVLETYSLSAGRAIHFYKVVNPSFAAAAPSWLTGSQSLTFDGANQFNSGLRLTTAGAISQSEGSILTLTNGPLIIDDSSEIKLSNGGNRLGQLGNLTSRGKVTITSGSSLKVGGNISSGGAIAITVTSGDIILSQAVTSRGGAVTISASSGAYDNASLSTAPVNSPPGTQAVGFSWTTTDQNLDLTALSLTAGSGTMFAVGTATFTPHIKLAAGYKSDHIYFSNRFGADRAVILERDSLADFHILDDLTSTTSGSFSGTTGDNITFSGKGLTLPKTATVTFWNVQGVSVDAELNVAEIRFDGKQNRFISFKNSSKTPVKMVVARGTNLGGNITVGSRGIVFEDRSYFSSGTLASAATDNLVVSFEGDFLQNSTDGAFDAGTHGLELTSMGSNLRLLNPRNRFATISLHASEGQSQIVTSQNLIFTDLQAGGGSVSLIAGGSISATGIRAGSVGFRAGGSVLLSGDFLSARGSGQAISLTNNTVVLILGELRSDSSLYLGSRGSLILTGDMAGGTAIET